MENATKALLIAGSVLVAILLIAMGVKIFRSTSGTVESAQTTMDATAVAAFNNKFLQYAGSNKSKSQVIALANAIIANNATADDNHKVTFSCYGPSASCGGTEVNDIQKSINFLTTESKTFATFTIKPIISDNGLIERMSVSKEMN